MLSWMCERCAAPIGDRDGYLTVDEQAARRFPEQQLAWEAEELANTAQPARGFTVLSGEALQRLPQRVHWAALHATCDPRPDRDGDYVIRVERFRTPAQVLDWTAHLWNRPWVRHTDWDVLLRQVITQLPD